MLIRYLQVKGIVPNLQQHTLSATDAELAAGVGAGGGGRASGEEEEEEKSDRPSKRQRTAATEEEGAGGGAASAAAAAAGTGGPPQPTAGEQNGAGSLLKGFFGFIAEIPWSDAAISVRLNANIPRASLRCSADVAEATGATGSAGASAGAAASAAQGQGHVTMVVEDPFNLDHNTTAHFSREDASSFLGCARVARDKMLAGADFLTVLSAPVDEKSMQYQADKAARQKLRRMMKRANVQGASASASILVDLGWAGDEAATAVLSGMGLLPLKAASAGSAGGKGGTLECSVVQNTWVGTRQRRRAAKRAAAAAKEAASAAAGGGAADTTAAAAAAGSTAADVPQASSTSAATAAAGGGTDAAAAASSESKPLFKIMLRSRRAEDCPASPDGGGAEPVTRGPGLLIELSAIDDRQTALQFVALFKKRLGEVIAKA